MIVFDPETGVSARRLVSRAELEVVVESVLAGEFVGTGRVIRIETLSRLGLLPDARVLLPIARVVEGGYQLKYDRHFIIRSNVELEAAAIWLSLVETVHPRQPVLEDSIEDTAGATPNDQP